MRPIRTLCVAGVPVTALSILLLLLLSGGLTDSCSAAQGRLIVLLEGELAGPIPPALTISGADREEAVGVTALSMAAGVVAFEALPLGIYRIEMRIASSEEAPRPLEVGVFEGLTTVVRAEVATGELRIDALRPDPFGFDDAWSADWLRSLPGAGTESASSLAGTASTARITELDGLALGSFAMRDRPGVRGESIVRSLRVGLGSAPAVRSSPTMQILSVGDRNYGDLELATGSGGHDAWEGTIARAFPGVAGSPRAFLSVGGRDFTDADPSPTTSGKLPHNSLQGLELLARIDARPEEKTGITASVHGEGTRRDYFVEAFRNDLRHSPRVDRAGFEAQIEGRRALGGGMLLKGSLGFQRTYAAGGDGRYFDDLLRYQRVNQGVEEGEELYWPGDNPDIPEDQGHIYNYFRKDLQIDRTLKAELWKGAGTRRAAGAGIEVRHGTYRSLEHINPVNASAPAQTIGYDALGENHDDSAGNEPGSPLTLAGFADIRRPILGGDIEGGIRVTMFRPGQKPLRDLSNPLGTNQRLDGEDLDGEKTFVGIYPRIGFTRPLGAVDLPLLPTAETRAWLTAGIETAVPPSRAVYYSASYLDRTALTLDSRTPPKEIFGNPGLEPERTVSAMAALGAEFPAGFRVSAAVEGRRTTDAWTPRYVEVGADSLAFYVNDGERDRVALLARLGWDPTAGVGLRVLYNLSRTRTETVEPFLLESAWTDPDLPIQGIDTREGLPLLPTIAGTEAASDLYSSLWDRRHQVAAAVLLRPPVDLLGEAGRVLLEDVEVTVSGRAASGAPFAVTQLYPAGFLTGGAYPSLATGRAIHAERLPWTGQLDARAARTLRVLGIEGEIWVEALNITDRENVTRVYTATGDARDDGWLDSAEGADAVEDRGEKFADAYRARLLDSFHYGEPFQMRIGARLRFP